MGLDQPSLLLAALKGFPAAGSEKRVKIDLHYHPETDSLYMELNPKPSTDSWEISEGLVADFDAEGNMVGLDIQQTLPRRWT